MEIIVLQSHDCSPNATCGYNLVPGLKFAQHLLPLLLPPLLRHDQEEVKDGEDEDEGREAQPSHRAAGLNR